MLGENITVSDFHARLTVKLLRVAFSNQDFPFLIPMWKKVEKKNALGIWVLCSLLESHESLPYWFAWLPDLPSWSCHPDTVIEMWVLYVFRQSNRIQTRNLPDSQLVISLQALTGWDMWKETAGCQTDSLKNATSLSRSCQWGSNIPKRAWSTWEFLYSFSFLGRQNSNQMDCSRSYSLPKVYLCQWCLELWNRDVGGCVLWRETLLGDDQSRCKYGTTLPQVENEMLCSLGR